MSKIAYSQFASPWWTGWRSTCDDMAEAQLLPMSKRAAPPDSEQKARKGATAVAFAYYAVNLFQNHKCPHYFVAPGVAAFCVASAKTFTDDYLRPFPIREFMTPYGENLSGGLWFHFPAKEQRKSILVVPAWMTPENILANIFAVDSGGANFLSVAAAEDRGNLFKGSPTGSENNSLGKLVYGLSLYMDAFPDAIVPAADGEVHHIKYYKGPRHVVSRSPVMEHEERQARSPHWRRGHFRVLHSPKFVHKRGQTVFIRGTFVRGQAFDILADTPK
jgi:hypothetical protein